MNDLTVKICGLRELEHARVAVDSGADLLGFNFASTRRYVAPDIVATITRDLPRSVPSIGLFLDEDPAIVRSIAEQCGLAFVQLCGDESLEYCRTLGIPVVKSLRVRGPEIVDDVERYARVAAWCLLDAYQPNARGGTGTSFDWNIARDLSSRYRIMVAGGLSSVNVAEAIRVARPFGVDVSSGVETDGRKDPAKIAEFIAAARHAATTLPRPTMDPDSAVGLVDTTRGADA
jgi:phosphoribosylanthranilate isomerase